MRLRDGHPGPLWPGRVRLSALDLVAVAVVALSVVIRLTLVAQGWPPLNSDEATVGLMALHIVHRGELPIFVYGQSYVGALEAYAAAALFFVFGPSDFALRFGQALLFATFLAALYRLAYLLYSRRVGVASIAILSLGSPEILSRQLEASGGYMEMLLFGTASLLLASWLVLRPASPGPRRRLAYVATGLSWGLGFWSHYIVLPMVLASALLLVLFCRDELRRHAFIYLAAGLIAGLAPVILHDVSTFPHHTSIGTLVQLYAAGGTGASSIGAGIGQRLAGALLVGLPLFTGVTPVCALPPAESWPLPAHAGGHAILCTAVHGTWSATFITLWLIATATCVIRLRMRRQPGQWDAATALTACRLATLGVAGLTLALYTVSPAPAIAPRPSARYLLDLWVAVPALVAVALPPAMRGSRVSIARCLPAGLVIALAGVLTLGTVEAFGQVPYMNWQTWEQDALITNLERIGATRIYTDYWTCYRIAYQSREHIICAVLDSHLRPAENRYVPYVAEVGADRRAALVFPRGTPYSAAAARFVARAKRRYRRFAFNFYVVYQPS